MTVSSLLQRELTSLLQSLIQTPSVNGVHGERAMAERVAAFAQAHGLATEIVARDAERPSVLVRLGPPGDATLLLVAHLDTVAVGDETRWTYSPFGGEVVADRVYGRGAVDNKGGLVAALGALLLLQAGPSLPRPILLAGVPDEESGATGVLGVKHLHAHGKLSGRGAIYTYPGTQELSLGHRGVLRLRLIAHGQAIHSGLLAWQEGQGCNAVTGMAEILRMLEGLRFTTASRGLFAPYRTVITPTVIHGGVGPSMVPDRCEAYIDVRLVPEVSRAEVERAIAYVVAQVMRQRPGLRVETIPDVYLPPTLIPTDSPIVTAVSQATQAVMGLTPTLTVSGPANESYLLNSMGIPTCVFGPEGDHAHAADEWVSLDSLFAVAEVYAATARSLATLKD